MPQMPLFCRVIKTSYLNLIKTILLVPIFLAISLKNYKTKKK